MRLLSCKAAAEIDKRAVEEFDMVDSSLMESAAIRLFDALEAELGRKELVEKRFVFIAGAGNNGGDALALARRFLIEIGVKPIVVLGKEGLDGLAGKIAESLGKLGIPLISWQGSRVEARDAIQSARYLIDGISGTGLKGALRETLGELVKCVNEGRASGAKIVSIDLPSGLSDGYEPGMAVVSADICLCIESPKLCQYSPAARSLSGDIRVVQGVFPKALFDKGDHAELIDEGYLKASKAEIAFSPDAYKNKRGHLAVFAGSPGFTGAASLASEAALRAGAGLVTLVVDAEIISSLATSPRSLMIHEDSDSSDLPIADAYLAGPGWGSGERRLRRLQSIAKSGKACCLDADALNLLGSLARKERPTFNGKAVLTPHPGELSRLSGKSIAEILRDPAPIVISLCEELEAYVALKGHTNWIAGPDGKLSLVDGMNGALATAGSGDLLAGIVAGLLARGIEPRKALEIAVIAHQLIGARLASEKGSFIADDMLMEVGKALYA